MGVSILKINTMSLSIIKDSVETGYNMKLFKTMNDALYINQN